MLAEVDESWLSRRYYGGDLSPDAERLLHLAAANYADTHAAEGYLAQAAELAPNHRAVDLGFYKFHFYKHNLTAAMGYAERMIVHALKALHLHNRDWRTLDGDDAAFSDIEPAPRFLLFSLTARGYLLLRLGEMDAARETLNKVAELDPADRFAARRLLAVADRAERDDDDDDDETPAPAAVCGTPASTCGATA
jgi:tetratricopeptide (TPR) repeat protein